MQLHTLPPQFFSGVIILIIDNNNDVKDILSFLFEDLGGEVISTNTANQAMDLLDNRTVDIIISELALPEENGYTLMQKVKTNQISNQRVIPAIAISGWLSKYEQEKALVAGFDKFIPKPIVLEELTEEVATLVLSKF